MTEWLVRQAGSEPIGPVSTGLVLRGLQAGKVHTNAEVCRVGTRHWVPITQVPELTGSAFDDDSTTNVTDSPWFMQQPPSMERPAPRPAPPPPFLGLPPPRPPLQSQTRVEPPPTRPTLSRPSPASMTRPSHGMMAGQRAYDDVDDDAATRVANAPSEARALDFAVDDETMTRVAAPGPRPAPMPAPPSQRPRIEGVLPTMPMGVVMSERAPAVPSPRPAAGAPPPPSAPTAHEPLPPTENYAQMPDVEVHPSMRIPLGSFPPVGGAPAPPPPQDYARPPEPPAYPPYGPPGLPPQYHQVPPPEHGADQGLKALVLLIVLLAMALAIVVILLIVRH